jgi:hypothetical protein
MAELVTGLVIGTKGPRYKIAAMPIKKIFCHFLCFESHSVSMINPGITLSSALMKDQHVKVCLHVGHSLGSVA